MAESVNGGSNTPAQPPKEMSMEVRLLLAFLLMGAVMFLTPYFFKSQIPPPGKKDAAGQTAAQGAPGAPSTPARTRGRRCGAPGCQPSKRCPPRLSLPAGATPQKAEPPFVIETDLYKIAFSNQGAHGAQLAAQEIQGQRQQDAGPGQHRGRHGFPVLALLPEPEARWPTSTGPGTSRPPDPDGLGVTYEFSDGHVSVRKVFRFQKDELSFEGVHRGHAGRQAAART